MSDVERFGHLRAHPVAHVTVSLAVAIPGLLLGPLLMEPAYQLMQPMFQATTLLWVELLFAFLIDVPLTLVATVTICAATRSREPGDAVVAGLTFLGIFFALIGVCIAVGDRVPGIGPLALSGVFPPAVSAARDAFGTGRLAVMTVLYVLFDVTMCTAAATTGHWLSRPWSGRRPAGDTS